jgi:hypothetical protein
MLQFALLMASAALMYGIVRSWPPERLALAPDAALGDRMRPERWSAWAREVVGEAARPVASLLPFPRALRGQGPWLMLLPGSLPRACFWPLALRLRREGYSVRFAPRTSPRVPPTQAAQQLLTEVLSQPPAQVWIAFGEAGPLAAAVLSGELEPRPKQLITLGAAWPIAPVAPPFPPTALPAGSSRTLHTDVQGQLGSPAGGVMAAARRFEVSGAGRVGLLWSLRAINLVTRQVKASC